MSPALLGPSARYLRGSGILGAICTLFTLVRHSWGHLCAIPWVRHSWGPDHQLTTNLPPTDHQPADHQPTTGRPATDQQPTSNRPPANHEPTTNRPPTDHRPTTNRPPTDHQPTTIRPPISTGFSRGLSRSLSRGLALQVCLHGFCYRKIAKNKIGWDDGALQGSLQGLCWLWKGLRESKYIQH